MTDTPLQREVRSWNEFMRSLPREDREAFDALMVKVLSHEGTGSNYGRANPFETMTMLALIELVKERIRKGRETDPISQVQHIIK